MRVFRSIQELSAIDGPVAVTVGFFDGVHLGHQSLLTELSDLATDLDASPLVITFPNSPRAFHMGGDWQYLSLPDEKLHLLDRSGVESVLLLDYDGSVAGQTAAEFFRNIGGSCELAGIVAGYDSAIGCDMVRGSDGWTALAGELAVKLQLASPVRVDGAYVKSSTIRECIVRHDLRRAMSLLGRPYLLQGTVEHGKGKGGKELQIPTANVYLRDDKLAPPTAIYAARVEVDGRTYPAATCIMDWDRSQRTVLEAGNPAGAAAPADRGRVVEAYLIGFEGNLYGQTVGLGLMGYIRDWIDFESAEQLAGRIRLDIEAAKELCGE